MTDIPAAGDTALRQAGAVPLLPADPTRIGPYVPLGLLGSGGMGRVYLARRADDAPGLAAVKVIRPEYAEGPDFRRRFEREAAVHGRVRTPRAPHLLGTGFDDALLWMATEYLPGLSLAEAVRECGLLEPAGVWRLVAELGEALSALAAAGVVHRDLKPSNVILSPRGTHVIDFGISRAADSSAITTTGNRVGTAAYMAPEYLREGRCDAASDVFSLGCTIVYAATGHAPFGDGTGVDVMHRVAFEAPDAEVMADIAASDPALAALLSACLAKDPAGRPGPRQLIDAATAAGHGRASDWHEPLAVRLRDRQRGCAALEGVPVRQSAHFRTPVEPVLAPVTGPATGTGGRRRPLLAAVAGIAVGAVAVGAFLLTRPGLDSPAAAAPTSAGSVTAATPTSSGPSASASASGKDDGEKEKGKEKKKEKKDTSEVQTAAPEESNSTPSAAAAHGGGSAGGGSSTTPTPTATVTKTAAPPATPSWISGCTYYSGTELTDYGDKGQRVVQVQCMLTKRGYSVGGSGVDGEFGRDTQSAVKQFQSAKGLEVDGQVGPNTWAALRSST
ncbi:MULTISPECIES: serine/threonine-protein kinase [Streptomyces]|uniref:Serine/threonine protein kinase n=1 Tax=Streptomyces sviceus (strain ATCC 29083 / DSM 924 / JCM 4929 / NBRC 13980 / NCIMB 11184 / NRRL 5439 / UC 5370) TaxID=463191 RepID=B5HVF1_STRX2|nr:MULTISPECIES: serine/threonine-protein kinase [Streptomyces]EDY56806.2 serine/threonine protein kinase [Streptomyces sviceus ATCC 29083]MYT07915.1 protein kinase [Streptomyces sp. SID5470]